jgi:hypothetical protein
MQKLFTFYRWLSMRKNSFLGCSVRDEIVSSYAQCAIKSFSRMLSMRMLKFSKITQKSQIKMQILTVKNQNFEKPFRNPSNKTKGNFSEKNILDISQKKFGSAYAQSPQKCSNFKILAKIEGKEAKFFSKIYQGHIRI